MNRVVILGRGGAGKSTFANQLAKRQGLPVIELDKLFWNENLQPTGRNEWEDTQRQIISQEHWIIDGDLGPYDVDLGLRLAAADTVIVLDYPLWRCALRALRRHRESREFWRWTIRYSRDSLPAVNAAIAANATDAQIHVLRMPRDADHLINVT